MNIPPKNLSYPKFLSAAIVGIAFGFITPAHSAVIYQDTFSRAGALNGSAPDVVSGDHGGTAGATWNANSAWTTNSTVASVAGASNANSYLPFTPVLGETYTLSMNVTATSGSWLAMGFIIGAGSSVTDGSTSWQSISPPVVFWDLLTPDGTIQGFGGGGTSDQKFGTASGSGSQGSTYTITLQKTSNGGDYTYSYSGPGVPIATYTKNIGGNTISGVGFGMPAGSNSGTIDNFTLVTDAPEPSSALAFGLGALGLIAFRSRFRRVLV